jgi:ketosteroid isomerase-like protein
VRGARVIAVLLLAGCAATPDRDPAIAESEAKAFVLRFEQAIDAHDWEALLGHFDPDAFVMYQEPGAPGPARLEPGHWIDSMAQVADTMDFHREKRIRSMEIQPDTGRVLVRSRIVETVDQPGARLEVTTDELMTIDRRDGALVILGLALWIDTARVEPLGNV